MVEEFDWSDRTTQWLEKLRVGDSQAIEELWKFYYPKLRGVVGRRSRYAPLIAGNESDIAGSALGSFCRRTGIGEFQSVEDRDELWALLKTITVRKANDALKRERAMKRGGHLRIIRQSAFADSTDFQAQLETGANCEPPPEVDVEIRDLLAHLINNLPDENYRKIVTLKLQGAPTAQIAQQLDRSVRTIQRRLEAIESLWTEAFLAHAE